MALLLPAPLAALLDAPFPAVDAALALDAPAAEAPDAPEAAAVELPDDVQSARRSKRPPSAEAGAGGGWGMPGAAGGPPAPAAVLVSACCCCQRHRKMRRPDVTASRSPEEWKAMHETTKSNSRVRTQRSVRRSQMRTLSSSEPDASMCRSFGWNLMVHGVRRCPRSVQKRDQEAHRKTLTVWSPCVLAKSTPSVLKASAIVDLASGFSLQYDEERMGLSSHSPADQRSICMSSCWEGRLSRSNSMLSTPWCRFLRGPYMVERAER